MSPKRIRNVGLTLIVVAVLALAYATINQGTQGIQLDLLIVFLGICLGAVMVLFLLHQFEGPEKEIELHPNEEIMLASKDEGETVHITFPKEVGGFLSEEGPIESYLYLTDYSLVAEAPDTGLVLFEVPLERINFVQIERKYKAMYLRVNYMIAENTVSEALFFTGDASNKWYDAIMTELEVNPADLE